MADLQATTPPSNADEKSHKELYVADLQSYRPPLNQRQMKRVTKSSMFPTYRPQPLH